MLGGGSLDKAVQILFISADPAVLTPLCEAVHSLLFPLQWAQVGPRSRPSVTRVQVYIPLLPAQMMEFLNAPMPFIVGAVTADLVDVELPSDVRGRGRCACTEAAGGHRVRRHEQGSRSFRDEHAPASRGGNFRVFSLTLTDARESHRPDPLQGREHHRVAQHRHRGQLDPVGAQSVPNVRVANARP